MLRQSGDVSKHLNTTNVAVILVMTKMVKVNLDIEEGLHKTIRKEAIDRGITMKAYLLEIIETGVKAKEVGVSEEGEEADAAKQ